MLSFDYYTAYSNEFEYKMILRMLSMNFLAACFVSFGVFSLKKDITPGLNQSKFVVSSNRV